MYNNGDKKHSLSVRSLTQCVLSPKCDVQTHFLVSPFTMPRNTQTLYYKTLSSGTSVAASCCLTVAGAQYLLTGRAECGLDVWTAADGALDHHSSYTMLGRVTAMTACGDDHVLVVTADGIDR